MPDGNRFTSIGTRVVSRTPAHDIVSSPLARQSFRFAPDSTFFMTHIRPMRKVMTELVTVISALMSLIIAVMPVITAPMIVLIALMSLIIRVMSVMTALMTDITEVMSVIIRIMWLISGMIWLFKNVLSVLIALRTGPDRGAESPPIAPSWRLVRVGITLCIPAEEVPALRPQPIETSVAGY